MSTAINFNQYKKGNIEEDSMRDVSENLPKDMIVEIRNITPSNICNNEFNLFLIQRKLNDNFICIPRKNFFREEDLHNWYSYVQIGNKETSSFEKTVHINLDKIPETIEFLDIVIETDDIGHISLFGDIIFKIMTIDGVTKIKYLYSPKDSTSILVFGTLAKTDANEWKFFPIFEDYFGHIA